MRKILFAFFIFVSIAQLQADPPKTSSKSERWMKDQGDQTDTFAIPLDSSEEEEQQELQELEKKNAAKSEKRYRGN
jgi:hypothetical protein